MLGSRGPAAAPAQVARLSLTLPADGPLTSPASPACGPSIALSRDGRRLVYRSKRNGRSMLVLRAIDRTEETVLRGTEGGFGTVLLARRQLGGVLHRDGAEEGAA